MYGEVWEYIDPDKEGMAVEPLKKPVKVTNQSFIGTPAPSAASLPSIATTGASNPSARLHTATILQGTTMSSEQQFLYGSSIPGI
jgi:hypothetical protein